MYYLIDVIFDEGSDILYLIKLDEIAHLLVIKMNLLSAMSDCFLLFPIYFCFQVLTWMETS